ncbi:MAG: IS1595 family transposase [Chloroflexota bacterium]|nr:IS1595 family transposase [Chloroflexota bacterium]
MARKAPGKSHREGLSLIEVMAMFPTEDAAREWIESIMWPDGRHCPKCGSVKTREAKHRSMPYWCGDCRSYFSVKTETPLANSNIPLQKWAIGIYLCLTSLKSVSSMKLHRDLKISQKAAWFMLHRIREAWMPDGDPGQPFDGPVEVDETYVGGIRKNMSNAKRKELAGTGRGAVGKTAVVGAKDRATNQVSARVVTDTDAPTLQGFVAEHAAPGATVYTDDAAAYKGMPFRHASVRHSVSEYVRGAAHTNGMESFWSMFERSYHGTFHKLSPKHLDRYVHEFAGRHNIRESGTLDQMRAVVASLMGRTLPYRRLIADNGLPSGARS